MVLAVVKVGGSLMAEPSTLKKLCQNLSELSKSHELVVVPGGGEFADKVRSTDKRFSLSAFASHRMAILGMDQYGFLLADLLPNSQVTQSFEVAKEILASHKLPVFLPSQIMFMNDPLENSWNVTSDSIAAYIAHQLHADKLLLIKDIDGIYDSDPKENAYAKLIEKITAEQLLTLNKRTSVDKYLPKILSEKNLDCYVINGQNPQRIEHVLNGQKTICTAIVNNL